MNDYSFLRLLPNRLDALNQEISSLSNIMIGGQVVISPTSFYLQKTNVPDGIAFDGQFEVFLIDECGIEVKDITDNVAITEFFNNGVPQIYFEILNIGTDYYAKSLCLRFRHTVSNYEWFSNSFYVTDKFQRTEVAYKNVGDGYMQSIGLGCFFDKPNVESSSDGYTSFDGIKRTSRLIITEKRDYIFPFINSFSYRRLNRLLTANILYVDGFLVTEKQTIESEKRFGTSDNFSLEFGLSVDLSQTFTKELQIFEPFELTEKTPIDLVTEAPELIGTFNRNISLQTGTIKLYQNSTLIATFTENDIIVTDNTFTVDISAFTTDNDVYNVRVDAGLFKSNLNELNEAIFDWQFEIGEAEFDSNDFNEDFLI